MTTEASVVRIAHRRAKPGCAPAYEALIRAMFEDERGFPGFLGAELIPPAQAGGEYQIVTRYRGEADLEVWNRSPQRAAWHARLRTVAEGDPAYRVLSGLEAWFAPPVVPASVQPRRWRMTVASWLGIFPTVSVLLLTVAPLIAPLPFLLRTAIFTALVALAMSYVVMPRLTRWLAGWLRR